MNKHFSLYIHIPFCVSKCNYCDFVSFVCSEEDKRDYFHALESEIEHSPYAGYRTVDTIYIGGGTPSSVDACDIDRVVNAVQKKFVLAQDCEISMESNPGTLSEQHCRIYRECGINRISMGVQAVQPHLLKLLGRTHSFADVLQSAEWIRNAGFDNMNLDLMFGLPQQSIADWIQTLNCSLQLEPEHLSVYSLIVEEGTPFWGEYADCDFITDETDRIMYHNACKLLAEKGYGQYEISNFAKKGFPCRHNLYCWEMEEYVGFGLNASSFAGQTRFSNPSDMQGYIRMANAGGRNNPDGKKMASSELESDYIILGLRKTDGIDLIEFKDVFHEDFMKRYHNVAENLICEGLLELKTSRLSLTEKGLDYANCVMREFI
ncbi:MAG: radical SAM family heme chaperone HemW [Anaerofustis sp.]